MIIKKDWTTQKEEDKYGSSKYYWTGWFLFGIIPLYLIRSS